MSILVVVADSSRARILRADDRRGPLQEVKDLVYPEARLREQELVADGVGTGGGNGSGSHSMGHEKDAHQRQAELFSRELCQEIGQSSDDKDVHKIYLVAAPRFLGLMRSSLNKNCSNKVVGELDKNLVAHSIADIRDHLPKVL